MQAPLVDNHVIVDVLTRLYQPSDLKPIDRAILSYLILRRCVDHEIFDSHQTIGEHVGSDRQTIGIALKRLEGLHYISVGGRGTGNSKAISINFDQLPAAQVIRERITPDARQLATRYWMGLQKLGKRKFPKNWPHRQVPSAQRILTMCGGDLDLAARMVGYALAVPKYKARSKISLYHLLGTWKTLALDYAAAGAPSRAIAEERTTHDECAAA